MSKFLEIYQLNSINQYIKHRKGEIKLGEKIQFITPGDVLADSLKSSEAKFVIFGIKEDIGVLLNQGRAGCKNAWNVAMKSLLNVQNNRFNKGKRLLMLGHLDFSSEQERIAGLPEAEFQEAAIKLIDTIDKEVTNLVQLIISSGKKAIVIGGGHNNAYGIIKGTALALNKPINVINIDAHTDFRERTHRHSGNGFSFAYHEGFLKRYFIFGLHENYINKKVYKSILEERENINFNTFEEVMIRQDKGFDYEVSKSLDFIKSSAFGLEIDCDSIAGIPSSAMTPTGFSPENVRFITGKVAALKNVKYLHICEAAPDPDNETDSILTGKLITYLVTDFLRG